MVFSTIIFLCAFLPFTIIGYYIMPSKVKNYFLLFMSLFFYAWGEPKFVWIMIGSICCNYIMGMWIAKLPYANPMPWMRKLVVILAVVINIGILFFFKYLTFTTEVLQRFFPSIPIMQIALPIGISFYTFQGLSYVIDVYRNEGKSENESSETEIVKCSFVQKNPFKLALYISMFPQLIAGPIVRYKDIKDSLDQRVLSTDKFASGISRFIIGLGKKAILANMTGALANSIMTEDFTIMSSAVAWLGAVAYTLQIYLDFSGYSDMAIGLGRIFGFEFQENFNYPYISRSVREFWRRWHMSLSGWFRDYLYIPLGGSKKGNVYLHLFIVFLATGIWHGAAWGFMLWGVWHGIFILTERYISNHFGQNLKKNLLASVFGWIYTMFIVTIGWVLFNLVHVRSFLEYVFVMFGRNSGKYQAYGLRYYLSNQMIFYLVVSILVCIPWKAVFKKFLPKLYDRITIGNSSIVFVVSISKKIILIILLLLSMTFIINSTFNPFIYFRF